MSNSVECHLLSQKNPLKLHLQLRPGSYWDFDPLLSSSYRLSRRMQNQICESMVECIDKKHKMKFLEINSTMCDILRQEIMQDTGHSKLKAKTLDLTHH